MIRVNLLRDKKDSIIERLSIKNFNNLSIIDDIINLDDDRKSNQLILDNSLSKVNNISKDIASLYKSKTGVVTTCCGKLLNLNYKNPSHFLCVFSVLVFYLGFNNISGFIINYEK